MPDVFAHIKNEKIENYQYLVSMSQHAARLDQTGRASVRHDAESGTCLEWSPGGSKNYVEEFKGLKAREGASERNGAAIGLHQLVGVSPSWIMETGDLHDRQNPRNRLLFDAAIAWARSWAGENAVFAARMDLDEAGGGVVDLFIAPVRTQKHRSGAAKPVISVNKAFEELALSLNMPKGANYAATQTSWAAFAKKHLGNDIQRGKEKRFTGREGLPTALFKLEQDMKLSVQEADAKIRLALQVEQSAKALMDASEKNTIDAENRTAALASFLEDPTVLNLSPPHSGQAKWTNDGKISDQVRKLLPTLRQFWPAISRILTVLRSAVANLRATQKELDVQVADVVERQKKLDVEQALAKQLSAKAELSKSLFDNEISKISALKLTVDERAVVERSKKAASAWSIEPGGS